MQQELEQLHEQYTFRCVPLLIHEGRYVRKEHNDPRQLLNLASNDYLGLASDLALREEFLSTLTPESFLPSASSSRMLTGNFREFNSLEIHLGKLYGADALVFNSGYHANIGILPAVSNARTLILADKLVHASLIDGIRLSTARSIRYRHNDYEQLERLVETYYQQYEKVILVTEAIFSMDGDEADLTRMVQIKNRYPNVLLYVDEAHSFGVRGPKGLGCAEEQGCIGSVDFLVGTFGKALASTGAFVICQHLVRTYLVNRMRTLIFTTALPPVMIRWTCFVLERLPHYTARREQLAKHSLLLREALKEKGLACPSTSHIIPLIVGKSKHAVGLSETLKMKGFHILPVRPPTVPEGTSRLRISMTADVTHEEVETLIRHLPWKILSLA